MWRESYNVFNLPRDLMLTELYDYMWKPLIPSFQIVKFNGHRPCSSKDMPCGGKDTNI